MSITWNNFVNQESIKFELEAWFELMKQGENFDVIFKAPSGYGKTTLAELLLSQLDPQFSKFVASDESPEYVFNRRKRFHLIDEAHKLRSQESLYPFLDMRDPRTGRKVYTVIFATNVSGNLIEPLRNRCIELIFSPYTREHMKIIIQNYLEELKFELPNEHIEIILDNSNDVPREAKTLVDRSISIFKVHGLMAPKDFTKLINDVFGIVDGLNREQRRYLAFLKANGSTSLDNLMSVLSLDKATITERIEPILITRRLIKITRSGRDFNREEEMSNMLRM